MDIYFDGRQCVPSVNWSTPSHDKALQFRSFLGSHGISPTWRSFEPLRWEDWEAVHDAAYVERVRNAEPALYAAASVEPTPELAQAQLWSGGSFCAAAMGAMESGVAISPTCNFHHAHFAEPGVFCLLNGLALAAVQMAGRVGEAKILILDGDYHVGNGTDDILARINQPQIEHLTFGRWYSKRHQAGDYLKAVERICQRVESGDFGLVLYQAGMDVLVGDPAGGGILTYAQTYQRDHRIFSACHLASVPVAWNFAGGYRTDEHGSIDPVLLGHLNTLRASVAVYDGREDLNRPLIPGSLQP